MPCLNGSRLDAQLAAALTLLVLLCACARGADAVRKYSSPPPPPRPPREICGRNIVVTEFFNLGNLITPSGIDLSLPDLSPLIGYHLGYVDEMFFGAGTSNVSVQAGMVTSVCYFLSTTNNYCTSTLSFGSFGDITFLGPFNDFTGNEFQNPIAGGTGIFTGAQGTVTIKVLNGGEAWLTTVELLKAPKCT